MFAAIGLLVAATAIAANVDDTSVEGGPHDVALEVLLPIAVLLGLAACAWRLQAGGSWWWAVPAAAFLAGVAFPLHAWSDFVPPPDGDGCGNDGMLPEAVREAMRPVVGAVVPMGLASLVTGGVLLARRGTRWVGAWAALAGLALVVGAMATVMPCV